MSSSSLKVVLFASLACSSASALVTTTNHSNPSLLIKPASVPQNPNPPEDKPAALPVPRDDQSLAVVQRAAAVLAKTAPSDTVATGTVTIEEGSSIDSGTIQIFTRGVNQTIESLILSNSVRSTVYSKGVAQEGRDSVKTEVQLELAVSDQCSDFPLPVLLDALNNPDEGFRYVGLETIDGNDFHHVQIWNTFASNIRLQQLAPLSLKDVWFDATTGLPSKISYMRYVGGGAVLGVPFEIVFSKYTDLGGVSYPFQITKYFNGTLWQTITIDKVVLNSGLTDSQFVGPYIRIY